MPPKMDAVEITGKVAVIGMSCILPGAPDLATYWQNIISKVDAISDPPPESWDAELFYDPDSSANDRVYCKRGGYIGPLATFNPLEYGVMPRTVEGGEPDQWLALQVARAAFTDAGYGEEIPEARRTAVVLGKGTYLNRGNLSAVQHGRVVDQTLNLLRTLHPEYSPDDLETIRQELKKRLPPFNADTAPGLIPNIIAGRIANRLNLMGPSYTVDGACASSLLALEIAVRELLTGRCDLALVGGAHVVTPVPVLMLFCQLNALSRQEKIRPFDKKADGTLLGEGIGMAVLKRLEQAQRDGNRIYAVIDGIGTASDGRGLSVMAPRLEGEVLALERAYEMAGVSPRSVGLIEAHGTGTPVGDETEIKALAQVFGPGHGLFPPTAMGSVKSMIGHVMPAAGIAGLIKASLALHHKVLPPTLHVDEPHPQLTETPFYLNTETRPWIHARHDQPRRAGINAFGFGGINAHVILEEAPATDTVPFESYQQHWDSEVIMLEAPSRAVLLDQVRRLRRFLQEAEGVRLKDLAYTLNLSLDESASRVTIVARDVEDLSQKLARVADRLADPECRQIKDVQGIYYFTQPLAESGQLAFLFPGEGSQYVNMLADLCVHFPEVRQHFDLIDRVSAGHARDFLPSDVIFPRPFISDSDREQAESRLWQMDGAVEAVLTANRAMLTLLNRLQIQPDALVGHSTGEYSAMLASGMIRLEGEGEVKQFSTELNEIYQQVASQGAATEDRLSRTSLVVVATSSQKVLEIIDEIEEEVFIALDNCPHQTVIVCLEDVTDEVTTHLRNKGLIYEQLSFNRPYHTPLFEAYSQRLKPFLQRWIAQSPEISTYSCTSSSPFTSDTAVNQQTALEHWTHPVEFQKTIRAMYEDGIRIFVEVGPGGNLTTFIRDILRGEPHLTVAGNVKSRSGISQLNHLVAILAAQGIHMELDYLYRHRAPRRIDLNNPGDPYGIALANKNLMKLGTGWPPLTMSSETAAQLRARQQPPPAGTTPTITEAAETAAMSPDDASALGADKDTTAIEVAGKESTKPARRRHMSDIPQKHGSSRPPGAAQVMTAYQQSMRQFLSVQQEVMSAYLSDGAGTINLTGARLDPASAITGGQSPGRSSVQGPDNEERYDSVSPVLPVVESGQPETVVGAPPGREDLRSILLQLVSERTGYPVEMLELNLDLEAELGIDSIKRVEILGSLKNKTDLILPDEMERLSGLKTLQEVLDFLENSAGGQPELSGIAMSELPTSDPVAGAEAVPARSLPPFITRILSEIPGQEVVAICELELEAMPCLLDHTLGRHISTMDPDLRGLPVVPLTLSMEMLAEGASLLLPDMYLVGMRDVRANRWIALEADRLTVELFSRRQATDQFVEVYACIREPDKGHEGNTPKPIVEGTMRFAQMIAEPPQVEPKALNDARPSQWQKDRLYRDGMFHGPAFRGVSSMDRIGSDGAEATLIVKPADELLSSDPAPAILTDPILLDQPGQVVGFWTAETLQTRYVIFPYHLEAVHLYDHRAEPGEYARCMARIQLIGEQQVRSDLDILGGENRLWARFEGWEDMRFDLPDSFYRFLLAPRDVILSQTWSPPLMQTPEMGQFETVRLQATAFPERFLIAHGGIWQKVLAHLILSRRERGAWRKLTLPEPRRIEWLLGRLAAKDAVRQYIKRHNGLTLCPADVEIFPDEDGRPQVGGAWLSQIDFRPLLSISHNNNVVVAISGSAANGTKIGIDVERLDRMNEDVESMAFSSEERKLLSSLPSEEIDSWLMRLWCAKEAVKKALGHRSIDGPRKLVVQAIERKTGVVQIGLSESLARNWPDIDREALSRLSAVTGQEDDMIVATSWFQDVNYEKNP